MEMSQKSRKSCLGCRCFSYTVNSCQLGYDIKLVDLYAPGINQPVPTEPCPKPLTNSDWLKARRILNKYQTQK